MLRLRPLPIILPITGGCWEINWFSPFPLCKMPRQKKKNSNKEIKVNTMALQDTSWGTYPVARGCIILPSIFCDGFKEGPLIWSKLFFLQPHYISCKIEVYRENKTVFAFEWNTLFSISWIFTFLFCPSLPCNLQPTREKKNHIAHEKIRDKKTMVHSLEKCFICKAQRSSAYVPYKCSVFSSGVGWI